MKPVLGQVCSLNSPFDTDVEEYAAGQSAAIEIWLTKKVLGQASMEE